MDGINLLYAQAEERSRVISNPRYEIALDLSLAENCFSSVTQIRFNAVKGTTTFVDFICNEIYSIVFNGEELDPKIHYKNNKITLQDLEEKNYLVVRANCPYSNTGEGLHRFVDPADGEAYLTSQFEVADSCRVFACFEQPDLKGTFRFTITAPSYWEMLSNMPTPEPVEANFKSYKDDECSIWQFRPTGKLSTYVTAIVAGPFAKWRDYLINNDGRTIPLGVYCRKSLAQYMDAENIFSITKKGFEFFAEAYNFPYPFEKYDQIFCPEFNAGAMENAGCVTLRDDFVFRSQVLESQKARRDETILHELAHMWFGDLVTMKWWNDLWLNESFANFMSYYCCLNATHWTDAWVSYVMIEESWGMNQDQQSTTHPIVSDIKDLDDIRVNFDGITYAKGGAVLRQLVAYVGLKEFFNGVHSYLTKHSYSNATLSDLVAEIEDKSGKNLRSWSLSWLERAGVNTIKPTIGISGKKITKFVLRQTATKQHPTLRPHRLRLGFYNSIDGKLVRTQYIDVDIDGPSTHIYEVDGMLMPDLLVINDDDLTYSKIRFDKKSFSTIKSKLKTVEDPMARAIIITTLWDMVKDSELSASQFIDIVLPVIEIETSHSILSVTLAFIGKAIDFYVKRDLKEKYDECFTAFLFECLQKAEEGTSKQLNLISNYAARANSKKDGENLKDIISGKLKIPGLEIDQDLRWKLVIGQIRTGVAKRADIENELETDKTAKGELLATFAESAIPSEKHKDDIFDQILNRTDLSNYALEYKISGFLDVPEASVLEKYVDKYYKSISNIWEKRDFTTASTIVTGLYPSILANEKLLEKGKDWLRNNFNKPDALKRLVKENIDATARAVKVQKIN
ncbi:MAG: aminopeptidase N [Bifidobacteriaceae bacterium]|jgi:aminopeptidase N|nr:aminopeptidase N [Bifidobacteriaceae bacterium]